MKKILCFGDSNTWGHNPVDCSQLEKPWHVVLRSLLPECEIISDGVCGRTSGFDLEEVGKNGLKSFERLIAAGTEADILIIMLGTNDLLKEVGAKPKESAQILRRYIRMWKSHAPKSKILIMSPVHIKESCLSHPIFKGLYEESSVSASHGFAQAYSQLAIEEKVDFMDAAKYCEASDTDGVHLEPKEHEKLARAVANKLATAL